MSAYDHKKLEKKWQKEWQKKKVYKTEDVSDKPKYFVLDMFPYPSGEGLHVGHPKGYIATDIVSRMKRMQGFNVLHPMGFDAFGLPAENYAIKTKTNPMVSVAKNVERYKKQLEILGFDYDWSREVNTTDPKFYKWTQWTFLKLLEKGLAYQSFEPINWCPSCKTGLANEDVEDGRCERCSSIVEKKPMRQWVIRITDYADRLLADLDALDWPESIKEAQRNWIGKSEGDEIDFAVKGSSEKIKVFTTRPDTIFGATYVVLAPEHELVSKLLAANKAEVKAYVDDAKKKDEIERTDAKKEKTGVELKGVKAINPANKEEVPVFVADYVLGHYGTGAVMAVPAHDERDFEFAKNFNLPVKVVLEPAFMASEGHDASVRPNEPFVDREAVAIIVRNPQNGKYLCNSWKAFKMQGLFTGGLEEGEDPVEAAERELVEETGYKNFKFVRQSSIKIHTYFYQRVKKQNRHAHFTFVFFDLVDEERDPVSKEEAAIHQVLWKSREELKDFFTVYEGSFILNILDGDEYVHLGPGVLIDSGKFTGANSEEAKKEITKFVGGSWVKKYKLRDWVFSRQRYWGEPFPIMHDGEAIVPVSEKDLPVELPKVKSYEPTGTGESPLADIEKWVNVKVGKGKDAKILKRETNTMPQWAGSSWYYLRYMDPKNAKAIVDPKKEKYWNNVDFYVGGAEHAARHLIYARFWHKFLYDIGAVTTKEPFKRLMSVGLIMGEDGRKMSKRFGNVVNPDTIVETYGADTMRVYEMFMGPFEQAIAWSTGGIMGSRRFLERVWKMEEKVDKAGALSKECEILLNKTIKKVTEDIAELRHNTAISSLMILSNELEKSEKVPRTAYEAFLKLLAPFAPHMAEEIWRKLGNKKSVHVASWPTFDPSKLVDASVTIVVQVNGKMRASFTAARGEKKEAIEALALSLDEVKRWMAGKELLKVIVIPDKLVSIVVKN